MENIKNSIENPTSAEAYVNRGEIYNQGDYQAAISDQAIRLNPNDARAYYRGQTAGFLLFLIMTRRFRLDPNDEVIRDAKATTTEETPKANWDTLKLLFLIMMRRSS